MFISARSRCNFVLLDKDESCSTADLSNIGRPNGPAYSVEHAPLPHDSFVAPSMKQY